MSYLVSIHEEIVEIFTCKAGKPETLSMFLEKEYIKAVVG